MNNLQKLRNSMTSEKKANSKHDLFAFYVGRPLSYLLTLPFLHFHIKPNVVSLISLVEVLIASIMLSIANNKWALIFGVMLFFLWNLLDGVDGNIARTMNIKSSMGSTWDAASGYAATLLTYFSMGCVAYNISDNSMYLVLGGLSAIFTLYPRLVLHKSKSEENVEAVNTIVNKSEYDTLQVIALNITSTSGLIQPIMLLSVIFEMAGLFTAAYFVINLLLMIFSLMKLFKGTL